MRIPSTFVTGLALPFAAAMLAASIGAQNPALTAHPQDTVQNGNGNRVPLGVLPNGAFAEGRTMILVPARELPTAPAQLVGIAVHGPIPSTVTYSSLTVNCAPTNATALQTTFANNIAGQPTTVLQASGLTVTYPVATWVAIPFTTPYAHNGSSALVIEIRKVVQTAAVFPDATMATSSSPPRTDRPNMVYALGGPGSGASTVPFASVAANPLSIRLQWLGTPTMRNRSDLGSSGNQYNVGGAVTLAVDGQPGHLYVLAAALAFLPQQLPIPGIGGALVLNGPVSFTSGLLGAAGAGTFAFTIPPSPVFVGFHLSYQAAIVDPVTIATVLTNGTDHFVNL